MKVSKVKCVSIVLVSSLVLMQQAFALDLDSVSGLKRFNQTAQLQVNSSFDVRGVKLGENVKAVTASLLEQGGELHYISGGIRSRRLKISFFQPYQTSRLEQRLELNFDKQHGIIEQIELTWTAESAYLSLVPVYQKVLSQAIQKYGAPMSMQQIQDVAGSTSSDIRLSSWLAKLSLDNQSSEYMAEITSYFEQKQVTPKTHFTADNDGNALLLTGFKQCYFWQQDEFVELMSLCSFQPSSGNMRGQGVTLTLNNFAIVEQIAHYTQPNSNGIDIEL